MYDRNCARCEHVLDCKGKPEGTKECINFKEREKHGSHKEKLPEKS